MVVTPRAFVVVDAEGIPQLVAMKDGKHAVLQKAISLEGDHAHPALPRGDGSSGDGTG
jgi:hypothetical protein